MNHLVNPGFEDPGSWEFGPPLAVDNSLALRSQNQPHSGSWSAFIARASVLVGEVEVIVEAFTRQDISAQVIVGTVYTPSFWVYGTDAGATRLRLYGETAGGSLVQLGTDKLSAAGWTMWQPGAFTWAAGMKYLRVQVKGSNNLQLGGWYVDEAFLDGPESEFAMLELIRAGLMTKLQGINGVSPYLTQPALVTHSRKELGKYESYPVLVLRPLRGDTEWPELVPIRHGYRFAYWSVFAITKDEDDTPDQAENLVRDVVRAIEEDQTLGNTAIPLQTHDGWAVAAIAYDPYEIGPEVGRGLTCWVVTIRTTFLASLGEI